MCTGLDALSDAGVYNIDCALIFIPLGLLKYAD